MNKKLLATAFAVSSLLIGIDCLQAMDCNVKIRPLSQDGKTRMLEIEAGKKAIRANIADLFEGRSVELGNGFGLYYAAYKNSSNEYAVIESDFLMIRLQKDKKDINNLFLEITDKDCGTLLIRDEGVEDNRQGRKGRTQVNLKQLETKNKNNKRGMDFVGDSLNVLGYEGELIGIQANDVFIKDGTLFRGRKADIKAGSFILGQRAVADFEALYANALNTVPKKREFLTFCEEQPDSYSHRKTEFRTKTNLTVKDLKIKGFHDVSFEDDATIYGRCRPVTVTVQNLEIDTITLQNTATFIFLENARPYIKAENGKLEVSGLKYTFLSDE